MKKFMKIATTVLNSLALTLVISSANTKIKSSVIFVI